MAASEEINVQEQILKQEPVQQQQQQDEDEETVKKVEQS